MYVMSTELTTIQTVIEITRTLVETVTLSCIAYASLRRWIDRRRDSNSDDSGE